MSCTNEIKNIMIDLAEQFVINKEEFKHKYNYQDRKMVEQGIHFCVKIDIEQLGYENDGNTRHKEWRKRGIKYLHYIVTGYHSVYTSVIDSSDTLRGWALPDKWVNTSNHDSCWRTDGFCDLFSEFIDLYNDVYSKTPEKHKPAPINCTYRNTLRNGWLPGPVFDFVELVTEYEEDGYHKKVLSVKPIKKTIEI